MRFGKIAANLLAVSVGVIILMMILNPGWGNPIATLGVLLILGCTPLSLIFGVVGVVNDQKKWLAIVIVVIASLLCVFWFGAPIIFSLCSWFQTVLGESLNNLPYFAQSQ